MFTIVRHKGFHIKFANGWTASVQWGPSNYASPRIDDEPYNAAAKTDCWTKQTAEVALINPSSRLVYLKGAGDQVLGEQTPEQVALFIALAAVNPEALMEEEE